MESWPSLTGEDDRSLLASAGARLLIAPGGHNIPNAAPEAIVAALRGILDEIEASGPA
jgi:hypothetical protein